MVHRFLSNMIKDGGGHYYIEYSAVDEDDYKFYLDMNSDASQLTSLEAIEKLYLDKVGTTKVKSGKGYASTYLKTVQSQLSCIFNHAVRLYELSGNPVQKAGPLGEHDSIEMQFWTKEEYLQFIPTLADKPYSYLAFELLYWCGMRMGELRALTVEDFDFDKKTIAITKSYQKIKGRDVITAPKTKRSIRTIVMPEQVAIEMKDFLDSIYGLKSTDRIFTFSKSYLHHEMDRGAKASGVKRIRVHDLRHSHECRSLRYF